MENNRPKFQWLPLIIAGMFLFCLASPEDSLAGPVIPGFYGTKTNLPTVATGQLPVLKEVIQGLTPDDIVNTPSDNRLDIYQQDSKAVIEWDSFDIGDDALTSFHQQSDWAALNRIYCENPTQIYGSLEADGTVYLINQNGIFFGPGSRINVHSLAASSLGIDQAEYLGGILHFSGDDSNGTVSNHGEINTDTGGWIFLIAPQVENAGTMNTPEGQIGLIAGNEAEVTILEAEQRVFPFIYVQAGTNGTAVNFQSGSLSADGGLVGLYGRLVQQEGLIRSVTAAKKNGMIELLASENISTGPGSRTISPITDDPDLFHKSFSSGGGEIRLAGLDQKQNLAGTILNKETATERIVHAGEITAPNGVADLIAETRVYLENSGVIDVSGEWVERSAESNIVTLQLNSMELKNDYGQKGGILQGEYINLDPYVGTSIGDASGALNYEEFTAKEMNTSGGRINIQALEGDIILREGSLIDFSGGGTRFSEGHVKTTALLGSDGQLYTISDAPQWMQYQAIMETEYYVPAHVQGHNAGYLVLESKGIVMDGHLNGSATRGMFQIDPVLSETAYGAYSVLNTRGTREPRGGFLVMGEESPLSQGAADADLLMEEVVLTAEALVLPEGFGPEDDLKSVEIDGVTPYASVYSDQAGPLYCSLLSTDTISEAGVSDLVIRANTKVTIENGAQLSLCPGGYRIYEFIDYEQNQPLQYIDHFPATLTVTGRAIEYRGSIEATSGEVSLQLKDTITTDKNPGNPAERRVQMRERIYLEGGSSLSVAGDRIDNSLADVMSSFQFGHTAGGDLEIMDNTKFGAEVIVRPGAVLDVSGGYEIKTTGTIDGGDAGSLTIEGASVVLEGTLKGLAVPKNTGGEITLHAMELRVQGDMPTLGDAFSYESDLPSEMERQLIVSPGLFTTTGFASITLLSQKDLTFTEGVQLVPSHTRMVPDTLGGSGGVVEVASEYLGDTSISAKAGVPVLPGVTVDKYIDTHTLTIPEDSGIRVAPGGVIDLSGLIVNLGGSLNAPAGDISIEAVGFERALTVESTGGVFAAGLNLLSGPPLMQGLSPIYDSMSGGSVRLTAKLGEVVTESGSVVDVSGPSPVQEYYFDNDGNLKQRTVAGGAGEVEILYYEDLTLEGELKAHSLFSSVKGGSFSISLFDEEEGMTVDLAPFENSGFDDLTLRSLVSIAFEGSVDMEFKGSLTMDTPLIEATGSNTVRLDANHIALANYSGKYSDGLESHTYLIEDGQILDTGDASLLLSGQYVDLNGGIALSGFREVEIAAVGDMRLADEKYKAPGDMLLWKGQVRTPGDLSLEAARIYPTTMTDFTLTSDSGNIHIVSSGEDPEGPILSAGGNLTIAANRIFQGGYVAAPIGTIKFVKDKDLGTSADRIYFSDNSVTTVAGEVPVAYGVLDDGFWTMEEKPTNLTFRRDVRTLLVETVPERDIEVNGVEVIVREGALIDASDGGSIFGYEFQPGIDGLQNPYEVAGRSVVMTGTVIPGEGVYLDGAGGLPSGEYSLLPEEYAFLPGAYVIQDLGLMDAAIPLSEEGYPVIPGYIVETGTGFVSQGAHGFSVRPASELLSEGHFNVSELMAGQGGNVTVQGVTTIIDGIVRGFALGGFPGGRFSVSGSQSAVVTTAASLPENFQFETPIPAELLDTAFIRSSGLSGQGFEELEIGTLNLPGTTVVMKQGAELESPAITLYASKTGQDAVLLEENSAIYGLGQGGTVNLIAPDGGLTIESGALVQADEKVNLNALELELAGVIGTPSLYIVSDNIGIVADGYTEQVDGVFYLSESLEGIEGLLNLGLEASSEITIVGDLNMSIDRWLIMDAPVVRGIEYEGLMNARITAQSIHLLNTGTDASKTITNSVGVLALAADNMAVGHGHVLLDGFNEVNLESLNDLFFAGEGSLTTSGDLNMEAARLALSYYTDSDISYEVAKFVLQAGDSNLGYREISLGKNSGSPGDGVIPGGNLSIIGRSIDLSNRIEIPGAWLSMEAKGSNPEGLGIILSGDAEILAKGGEYYPGGRVDLWAEAGELQIAQGALIDVSAGEQGDSGSVSLSAPTHGVVLEGDLRGTAQGGTGGSFFMDTDELSIRNGINQFSSLNAWLGTGGFDEEVSIRVRGGNVTIAQEDTVATRIFSLSADEGTISLEGAIDASGQDSGGEARLHAGTLLRIDGTIDASGKGDGGSGGNVFFGASEGYVYLLPDSLVDVSGGPGGTKGEVYMRAHRYESGAIHEVLLIPLGTIKGASGITTEAVKLYEEAMITASEINTWQTHTLTFMNNYAPAIKNRIASAITMEECDDGALHLVPGLEIQSSDDIRLASVWDTTSWRYGGEPGVLTLRAGGDLLLDNKILDYPTPLMMLNDQIQNAPDSWAVNLVAGADLAAADTMSVQLEAGDIRMGEQMIVYTENAPIRFASGGDVVIGQTAGWFIDKYMVNYSIGYSLATYSGDIQGRTGGNLTIDGGAIQSATGDIDLRVGGNLELSLSQTEGSAIRTTGTAPPDMNFGGMEWIYSETHDGGDIILDVSGSIVASSLPFYRDPTAQNRATPHLLYWDNVYKYQDKNTWGADYGTLLAPNSSVAAGLITMGGGSLTVLSGGDFLCQAGTFKEGDLDIFANGNISGFFQVTKGKGVIHAMGSLKNVSPETYENSLGIVDAQVEIHARGDIEFGTAFNPTYVNTYAEYMGLTIDERYLDYGLDSALALHSAVGSVKISGGFWREDYLSDEEKKAYRLLPPTLEVTAGQDIMLGSETGGDFILAPSETGNLRMVAVEDITGYHEVQGVPTQASLRLSDLNPSQVYGVEDLQVDFFMDETRETSHASIGPIHKNDAKPVEVIAGGSIQELRLVTPKATEVWAGNDISGLYFFGQNLNPTDQSFVWAEGDIVLSSITNPGYLKTGLISGGPGLFLVKAGVGIDMGITQGIQIVGNAYYSNLDDGNAGLAVIAGVPHAWNAAGNELFFDLLVEQGIDYTQLQTSGNVTGAKEVILSTEQEIIIPFLGEEITDPEATISDSEQISLLAKEVHHLFDSEDSGKGDIRMTDARISSMAESSPVYIITQGDLDVGLSTLPDPEEWAAGNSSDRQSGIFTTKGGEIGIYCTGDLNVNESRVMTFRGGDIIVWSHLGDINAGRGSKTAINAGSPRVVQIKDEQGNVIGKKIEWAPPAVGSGIRTLTYDEEILPGDAYLFATQGVIDAGEAGIAARHLVIGATEVVNAQNISFSQGGLGVPASSGGGASIGGLGGSGALAEASKLTEDTAGLGSAKKRMTQDVASLAEAFTTQWLDVKVIEFEEDEEDEDE